jgi:hypothetical protein
MIDGLWLFVLGCLAVPSLILSKRPDAKQVLDKITPYQGWIGLVSAVWGIFRIPHLLSSFSLFKLGVKGIIMFAIIAAFVITQTVLGFILGVGVIKTFVKDPQAQGKIDGVLAKVLPYQTTLGLVALIDGIALIIVTLVPSIIGF